jgi:hypothetical protein
MSENEYMTLTEAMKEVTDGQKKLLQSFNDFRVDIAEKYATKEELKAVDDKIDKGEDKHTGNTFNAITALIAAIAVIVAIVK